MGNGLSILRGWEAVIAGKSNRRTAAPTGVEYICERLVGCQDAIASRLTPTVGLGAFTWRLVGCQAAIASRLTPTEKQKPTACSSPLNRMSVSSAAALDLKGPFGRLSGGVYPGVGAQRPFGEAKHIERRCSEANRRRCPPDGPRNEGTRATARAERRGQAFCLLFGVWKSESL